MKTTITKILATAILAIGLSLSANAQMFCQAAFTYTVTGTQVNLTNTSVTTGTNTSYSWWWYGNSGYGNSAQTSPTFNFTYNGTYYFTLTMTDSVAGCNSSVTDSIVITNGQACQVSFTYTVGTNGQVSFTNTSLGNVSYYWGFGDGGTSTQVSPSYTYAYNGSYIVYLWADTMGGYCGGYMQDTIVITNAAPCTLYSGFIYNDNGSGLFVFSDTSTANPGTSIYSWYVNGGFAGYGNPFTYPFNSNGVFSVCCFVADSMGVGCSDSTCANVTVGGVTCNDSASFYLYPDSSALNTWNLYLTSSNPSNYPVDALWFWGDGTSSTGLYPSHTYASAGWYTICVEAYFACLDTSFFCQTDSLYRSSSSMVTVNVINTANAIHQNANNVIGLKAYPNPFADNVTINLNSVDNTTVTYSITDMYGSVVAKEKVSVDKGENKITLNTSNFGSGMYFVNVQDDNSKKMHTIKIVK